MDVAKTIAKTRVKLLGALVAGSLLLGAGSASAATILYSSNMSDFLGDFWVAIDYFQNPDDVTLSSTGVLMSATSKTGIPIAQLANASIELTSLFSAGDLQLAVSYWDSSFVEYGWEVIADVTGAGVFGGLGSSLTPPPQAEFFRIRLQMSAGAAIVDEATITDLTPIPEPATALLLGAALVAVALRRRLA